MPIRDDKFVFVEFPDCARVTLDTCGRRYLSNRKKEKDGKENEGDASRNVFKPRLRAYIAFKVVLKLHCHDWISPIEDRIKKFSSRTAKYPEAFTDPKVNRYLDMSYQCGNRER